MVQCCTLSPGAMWTSVCETVKGPVAEKVGAVFAVFKAGLALSNDWFNPFGYWVRTTRSACYQQHPVGARCLTIPTNTVLGLIKVLAFPAVAIAIMAAKVIPIGLTAAIGGFAAPMFGLVIAGVVAMPIVATVKFCQGKSDDGKKWLAAWVFALLAAAGSAGFLYAMAFHLTLMQTSILMAAGGALSIVFHVYRVAKEPPLPKAPQVAAK